MDPESTRPLGEQNWQMATPFRISTTRLDSSGRSDLTVMYEIDRGCQYGQNGVLLPLKRIPSSKASGRMAEWNCVNWTGAHPRRMLKLADRHITLKMV